MFAAIIIAQLVAPLFSILFNAKLGLLGGVLTPLGQIKADAINFILNPLGLALGAVGNCPNFPGRSFPSELELTPLKMIEIAENFYNGEFDINKV